MSQAIIKILLTPHITLKLFLLLCVLGTTGYASFLVMQSIMTYLSYGVLTTSRIKFENPTIFPKVTFCNLNGLTTQYAFNLSLEGFVENSYSNDELKKFGHDLNNIGIKCMFNGESCSLTDFVWSFDEIYGNCYTFNSGLDANGSKVNLKKSTIAGPYYGLQVIFYVNVYEPFYWSVVDGLGGLVRIGNSSYSSYYPPSDGILVSSGFRTNIVLEREFKSILPKPFSDCEIYQL